MPPHADPAKIDSYFSEIREPKLDAGDDLLVCGHSWLNESVRTHMGDAICYLCRRQDHVYDWDYYNKLGHIPEPGPRGSLQAAPQGGPW